MQALGALPKTAGQPSNSDVYDLMEFEPESAVEHENGLSSVLTEPGMQSCPSIADRDYAN